MGEHTEKNAQGSAGGGTDAEATEVHQPSVPSATSGDSGAQQAAASNGTPGAANGAAGGSTGGSRRAQREAKASSVDWTAVRERGVGLLAGIVRWVGLAFALVLVLHVIFVIGEANSENSIVQWVADSSESLAVGFHDLFQPADPKLLVLINYGIAAIFWLVVSSIVAKVIRRVGGAGA
ncbi:hypothetical protein LY13_000480 [Prauserella aidingensis]|uniref:hypothetical protein n=1 Tax=Prauserella aidingensis TaxID=387890 RepID=UPI00355700A0|nr:hypothetical protein [Prauserella aidingensis]